MEKKKCLIICDDDSEILEVTSLILDSMGYNVIALKDCRNYLERIDECNPDLILMDLWMPEETGDKITKLIKTNEKFSKIPVLLFSANTNINEVAKECGADGFIKKPFDIDHILKVIEETVKG